MRKIFKCGRGEWLRKTFVVFASDCVYHIVHFHLGSVGVVAVSFSLLNCLSIVVVQKLDKLVAYIPLVVLNA